MVTRKCWGPLSVQWNIVENLNTTAPSGASSYPGTTLVRDPKPGPVPTLRRVLTRFSTLVVPVALRINPDSEIDSLSRCCERRQRYPSNCAEHDAAALHSSPMSAERLHLNNQQVPA